ncbi:hypothetical protein [Methylocapsa palsarum]|uniref:Uncharacterized protein n=1 Tax=Methylocapsa palsarum TaxID=1612308 RepID=A0A1I3YN81_9HYPH|nr:hypothetical protein [Methylocapsa palsarum]SFK32741.1 hypothetical protein SAMN05444581_10634 [Methylocapsa palsarum]
MKKRTAPFSAGLLVLASALALAGASPAAAEGAVNPVQNASAASPVVQGPIVMGRSVALRHKTRLHHVRVKSAAVTASNIEQNSDVK